MENTHHKKFIINYENKIGHGAFGDVFTAEDINEISINKTIYAAKQINYEKEGLEALANEILINTEFQNENLVEFFGIYEYNDKYFLIFEYCNGGDLESNFKLYYEKFNKNFNEEIIQKIIKDILNGLSCLHRNNVIHHDLKFSNILVNFKNDEDKKNLNLLNATFKITDFGLSKFTNDLNKTPGRINGTPSYIPPCLINILVKNLNKEQYIIENDAVDMWSLGILTFRLIFNLHPFLSQNEEKSRNTNAKIMNLYNYYNKGKYYINLKDGPVKKISKEILIFLDGILKQKQQCRYSSEDCEYSRFITRDINKFHYIDKDNYFNELPKEFIEGDYIIFDINNEKKLKEYTEVIDIL
jgi:serine/threonine protein kinase